MKKVFVVLTVVILFGCNQQDATQTENKDSVNAPVPEERSMVEYLDSLSGYSPNKPDSVNKPKADTALLMNVSIKILQHIKAKEYEKFASFIHPTDSIRFSPYAYIDIVNGQILSAKQLISYAKNGKMLKWGYYDGKEVIIKMGISNYFDHFVYDKDFLNAKEKSVNKFLGGGNSLNNLKEAFPDSDFTEFYFPGFDPKYEGMDWRTLRLVFKTENNNPYLIAIVHDEWTI